MKRRKRKRVTQQFDEQPAVQKRGRRSPAVQNSIAGPATVLPPHRTTQPFNQAAILQMQRQHGNAYVQRYLAAQKIRGQNEAVQREEKSGGKKEEKAAGESKTGKNDSFDMDKWLHGKLYDALKEQLGEDKLKEHAAKLAKQAADLLMEQVKGATSEADFLQKAQAQQIGQLLAKDLKNGVEALLKSPEGRQLRQAILSQSKQDPSFAVGMALLGLGVAIAANAEIPELEKAFDLGAGFKAGGAAKLGHFRDLALEQVKLSLAYSSTYFKANLGGSYSGKDDKAIAQAGVSAGVPALQFNSNVALDDEGAFKLNFGPVLKLDYFNASTQATWSDTKGWSGVGKLQIGDKKTSFIATQVEMGADGEAKMGHSLGLTNPLGLKDFTVQASLHHSLLDPEVGEAKLSGSYDIISPDKDKLGRYIFVKFEGKYQPSEEQQVNVPAAELSGFIILGGQF